MVATRLTTTSFALVVQLLAACDGKPSATAPAPERSPTAPAPATPDPEKTAETGVRLPKGASIVDLTHTFDDKTLYWPTSPSAFELESLHQGPTEGGYFYASNTFSTPEHGGTHLDAPIHFAEGKSTTDTVSVDRLVRPAVVVDIAEAANGDPDALLGVGDLDRFEAEHGTIEQGSIVLIRTGWSARWPDRKRYLGDDRPGDASNLHFPGIGKDAAQRLVDRKVAAVGIDTASIDHGPSKEFWAHRVLMAADIPAFENVASLDRVPPTGSLVIALPMKIGGGSGGPLRIVAVLPAR